MNIIFANNYHYLRGGCERIFFNEMEMLSVHGHDVACFSRQLSENTPSHYSRYFTPYRKFEERPFIDKLFTAFNIVYSFESKSRFQEIVKHFDPDVIHGHNIYGGLTSSILDVARSKNIPFVMTLHDYKLICPSYLMFSNGRVCEACRGRLFFNSVLNRCHKNKLIPSVVYALEAYFTLLLKKYQSIRAFICPSHFMLNKCIGAGVDQKKLIYISNCIDTDIYRPSHNDDGYLLFVGRLSKEKGVMTLIRAVESLDIPLRIVGDGPMRESYETYAAKRLLGNISFEGYKTGDALETLYKSASGVVFPSECYENAPMSVLESFAYGKPVIGANIGGVTELIEDEKDGLLFESGNAQDLANKIRFFIGLSGQRKKEMGVSARKKVEDRFSTTSHYRALMNLYESILG